MYDAIQLRAIRYWACVPLLDHARQVLGVALDCGLTNVANLCEDSVGLLSWALRRCPRPNIWWAGSKTRLLGRELGCLD